MEKGKRKPFPVQTITDWKSSNWAAAFATGKHLGSRNISPSAARALWTPSFRKSGIDPDILIHITGGTALVTKEQFPPVISD